MGFRFRVVKVWQFDKAQTCHVIGLLEEGKIVPPITANVLEHSGQTVQIESIALGRGKPITGKAEELTLVVKKTTVPVQSLENCHLVSAG